MSGEAEASQERPGRYVRAFDRGLDILLCFSAEAPELTVSGIAARTGLDRATVRRLALTLHGLGYLEAVEARYRPLPRLLELGYSSLATWEFAELAQPYLDELSHAVDQSCSLGVFDGSAAVFVARAAVRRVMTISLAPGTRVPAYASAMGRVLLSGLSPDRLAGYLAHARLVAHTDRTVVDPEALTERIDQVRRAGWALLDQELELGVRSVAVPVRDCDGAVVAAISIGTHTHRVDERALLDEIVPAMRDCAAQLERDVTAQPMPLPGIDATPSDFAVR
ncbi:IclR family transcriptional regulator domain-containing protein [Pseudonocardia acaciae]|uniref:IclR family transcriptional regulator domain-containing protein n=1 Tax=Pseudonocardia acaciae TaxID=551276 RepID=UPI0007E8B91B|nr:IclR family transcriptional regulator C-terminal domain-containing protein [Pseudonocardia acaciae]